MMAASRLSLVQYPHRGEIDHVSSTIRGRRSFTPTADFGLFQRDDLRSSSLAASRSREAPSRICCVTGSISLSLIGKFVLPSPHTQLVVFSLESFVQDLIGSRIERFHPAIIAGANQDRDPAVDVSFVTPLPKCHFFHALSHILARGSWARTGPLARRQSGKGDAASSTSPSDLRRPHRSKQEAAPKWAASAKSRLSRSIFAPALLATTERSTVALLSPQHT
jgi:hypothetical protein